MRNIVVASVLVGVFVFAGCGGSPVVSEGSGKTPIVSVSGSAGVVDSPEPFLTESGSAGVVDSPEPFLRVSGSAGIIAPDDE